MLRIIKVARQWAYLQAIILKIINAVKDISYFSVIIFLFVYIFALLGMELFANYVRFNTEGDLVLDIVDQRAKGIILLPPRENFDSISRALLTIFIIIIGDGWPEIMMESCRAYGDYKLYPTVFFVFVYCIGNLMLLPLFMAILL
jgi:hypothetical protein